MPYYGARLLASDFDAGASDAEFRAAHNLWWQAWQQVPAASLPDNDAILCKLAGFGRDMKTWSRLRTGALHGFVLCDDGRLYHQFLAEEAVKSYAARLKSVNKREGDRQRLESWRRSKAEKERQKREVEPSESVNETRVETYDETRFTTPETGDETRLETSKTGHDKTGNDMKEVSARAGARTSSIRGSRLPSDWQPSPADRTFCLDRGLNVEAVAAKFVDHWTSKAGRDATKLDWSGTWRNWCRNERAPPVKSKYNNGFAASLDEERPEALASDQLPPFLEIPHVRD